MPQAKGTALRRLATFTVFALALVLLGQMRAGVPTAAATAYRSPQMPATTASVESAARRGTLHGAVFASENGSPFDPSLAPTVRITATDDRGDEDPVISNGRLPPPRDRLFIAEFSADQKFSDDSFFAPPKTGPPAV
jgi:hypothetical protein